MSSHSALGLVECGSLSQGAVCADAMLKTARVNLLFATAVSPGKLLVGVRGGVADVEAAVESGLACAGRWLEDALFIPRLHDEVVDALLRRGELGTVEALGLVETLSVAAALRAADAGLKAAAVRLHSIRLGAGIGGKALVLLSGQVADAEAAVEAAAAAVRVPGLLLNQVLIPQPHADYVRYLESEAGAVPPLAGVDPSAEEEG